MLRAGGGQADGDHGDGVRARSPLRAPDLHREERDLLELRSSQTRHQGRPGGSGDVGGLGSVALADRREAGEDVQGRGEAGDRPQHRSDQDVPQVSGNRRDDLRGVWGQGMGEVSPLSRRGSP